MEVYVLSRDGGNLHDYSLEFSDIEKFNALLKWDDTAKVDTIEVCPTMVAGDQRAFEEFLEASLKGENLSVTPAPDAITLTWDWDYIDDIRVTRFIECNHKEWLQDACFNGYGLDEECENNGLGTFVKMVKDFCKEQNIKFKYTTLSRADNGVYQCAKMLADKTCY